MRNNYNRTIVSKWLKLFCVGMLFLIVPGCEKITAPAYDTAIVWIVGEQTLIKSINAGIHWIDYGLSSNSDGMLLDYEDDRFTQTVRSVSFYNTVCGSIAGDSTFIATTRSAQDWYRGWMPSRYSGAVYSTVSVDNNEAYFCGANGTVCHRFYRTDSNAGIFQDVDVITGTKANLYGIDFVNPSKGWVVGDSSTVLYTTDKGVTWVRQTTAPGNIYRAVYVNKISQTSSEVWIAGDNGVIYRTTDDGNSWSAMNSGTTAGLTSICFTSASTAYFTGKGGIILKTTDNGISFRVLPTGSIENLNSISFMDANFGFAVGDNGTVLRTNDGGNSWVQVQWKNNSDLYGVCFPKRRSSSVNNSVTVDPPVVEKMYGVKLISGGTFQMGGPLGDEAPAHSVTVSAFNIDSTEVTQGEYLRVMKLNPSLDTGDTKKPVENVTWFDAVLYANARSKLEGKDTVYSYTSIVGTPGNGCRELRNITINYSKKGYRLPTEAEWEYACRAGTTTNYFWADTLNGLFAWYSVNSGNTTHRVGEKIPNAYGLYDMSGNVQEFCNDWFDYYTVNALIDPKGPNTGYERIIRGGSFANFDELRSRDRVKCPTLSYRDLKVGFRLVCQP